MNEVLDEVHARLGSMQLASHALCVPQGHRADPMAYGQTRHRALLYACMFICVYVYMFICLYVYICICLYVYV